MWAWIALTALFFVLRAGGAIRSVPLCFFLCAIAGALCFSLDQLRSLAPAHPLLRVRQIGLIVVIVAIPSLFDPTTVEIENLPRLVVIVTAAVAVIGTWAVDAAWRGWRPRRLINGFQWVFLGIVVWFAITTIASVEPRESLVGRQGDYEGFILLAALVVIAAAVAESFRRDELPALFRVIVAATIPVLVYGLIQVYGFDVHKKTDLDFVPWHSAFHNVFTTFGNPNHFGGFLVTVLPLGVVTAILARQRWVRILLWVWVAVALVLLLQTAARGAWLGALAGGAVLVVGLLPRLRARARTAGIAIGVGVVIAVVLVAGGSRFLGAKASALFAFGSKSSVSQRYGYWAAALHLAAHHPIVGTGPDTYGVTYAQYQSATLAKTLGTNFFVNGAHNIFLSWLANEGIPGFLLVVALFVLAVAWGVRAWLASRSPAGEQNADRGPATDNAPRYIAAAVVAAVVAYFVQACFDVEQVGTLFFLFTMLGLSGVTNRGTWTSAALARLPWGSRVAAPYQEAAEDDPDYPTPVATHTRRSTTQARQEAKKLGIAVVVALVALAAIGLTFWRTDAMWRADHAAQTSTQGGLTTATQLNPWEPSYFETLGEAAAAAYSKSPSSSDALATIQAAVSYDRQDVALDGANTFAQQNYGDALANEGEAEHSIALLEQALAAFHRALKEDPFDNQIRASIAQAKKVIAEH